MVVGEVATSTQLLVIGGGPGGYAAALHGAHKGLSVTLVERHQLGGVCLNEGCIPSKALIHAAETAALGGTTHVGVEIDTRVDLERIGSSIETIVAGLRSGVHDLLGGAGVTVLRGTARFSRPGRVAVDDGTMVHHLEFDRCVLATGSRPVTLPAVGVDDPRVLDAAGALGLRTLPRTMAVVGGGYIGVELGTAFAKLGTQVTIVEAGPRILPSIDKRASTVVARRLNDVGVTVITGTTATGLSSGGLLLSGHDLPLDAERVVIAIGRLPNTDGLGLEVAGVEVGSDGLVVVGPDCRATPTIAAIGDITPGPALAHKASAQANVAVAALTGDQGAAFDPAGVPEVVFSDPEVAQVGVTPDRASATGLTTTTFRFPFTAAARARTHGATAGYVEVTADEQGTVVGAVVVGHGASELISELTLAVEMAATVEDLASTIHPHPTFSEAIGEAAMGLLGHPLHITTPATLRRQ